MPISRTCDGGAATSFAPRLDALDTNAPTLTHVQVLQVVDEIDDAVMAEPLPPATDQARHSSPAARRLNGR
jgi:hypothetical protein